MNEDSSPSDLARQLRVEVARYPAGQRIATSRELVARYRVSASTVARAIAELAREGLVEARPGAGVFRAAATAQSPAAGDTSWQEVVLATSADSVIAVPDRAAGADGLLATLAVPPVQVIDLNGAYPHPSLQPGQALGAALSRAGRRVGSWSRPPVEGIPELRDWFAREIGGTLARENIIVCPGGQAALATTVRALSHPGEAILVESPTYPGTLAAARNAGLRPVPVPVDAEGMRTDLLASALGRSRARIIVVQPLFQNPTGASLSQQRRTELIDVARQHGAFVVEDDFARYVGHADAAPPPPPMVTSDEDGVVVHIRSLTKPTSPNLRVAALAARGPVVDHLRAATIVDTFFVPRPLQEAALDLVTAPVWPRHLRRLSHALAERRGAASQTIGAHLGDTVLGPAPAGGFHLWLHLPAGLVDRDVAATALRAGVAVTPGRRYFATDPPPGRLRISYCAAATIGQVTQGLTILGNSLLDRS
jgi:DNA-binding transcriptional MocR family regulator